MDWYLEVLRKYARFDGRARRKEYWYFSLFNVLIAMVLMLLLVAVAMLMGHPDNNPLVSLLMIPLCLYWLAVFIPSLAVSVRRLHDTGRSGWWFLICLVPFIGGIILFVFTVLDSQPGPNEWGPNPKGIAGYIPMAPMPPPYR